MTVRPFLMISLLLLASVAWGAEDEVWYCFGALDFFIKEKPLITLTRHASGKSGDVTVTGLEKTMTAFHIEGFERRWNWPEPGGEILRYAFVINPQGEGNYYDFDGVKEGGISLPKERYMCEMR